MKLTKVDIAEGFGMVYSGTSWEYDSDGSEWKFHNFNFKGKTILVFAHRELEEAWEEAAGKLLEPLVDYLLGNLDEDE